jgi:E3 ubiquitin-protein ligase TRIP12
MMEALPRSTAVIVDAIPTFLEKLQSIQCMDVAEQSLSALETLSKKHNKAILHAKGVLHCLTFLDFFSITAQRNALLITSNCCQGLLPEEFVHVQESLSILSSRLVHEDKKSSETACLAMSRLAESYKNDKNRLRDIATQDVLANLQRILVTNPPNVSSNTFVTVLHILVVMASHGSDVGPMLLEENIGATLRQLLVGSSPPATTAVASTSTSASEDHNRSDEEFELVTRNPQELYEITSLVAELMPPLPADGIFAVDALLAKPGAYIRDPVLWRWQDDRGNWHTYGYNDCR